MDKNGIITISNPQKGIANSAILGNEAIIGCEIFEEPGVIKIASALVADGSQINNPSYITISGVPVADVTNYNSLGTVQRTVLTESGQLMSISNADFALATNLSQGWDACVWNTQFTVVSYAQSGTGYIGVIYHDPTSNSATWFPAKIGSLDGTHYIKLLMGQDGKMYFTNGRYIGSITAISYSAGAVSVTSSSNVLDLKEGTFAVTIAELGSKLLIGVQKGISYSQRQNFSFAAIYPWDRTSSSFTLPIYLNENGINAMYSHRNQVYISAGDDGKIYVTDGTNVQLVKRLPFTTLGSTYNPTSWVYPNAMCINQKGNLLVGLSANYDSNVATTTGIWEISLTQGYPTSMPYFSRDGNLGDVSNVRFGSVRVLDNNALSFGVQSGTTYELSTTSATVLWSDYKAKWRTELFQIGTKKNRKSFSDIEFTLIKPLVTNQSVKLSYRKNLYDSFTTIGTFSYSSLGSVISHYSKALIADAEMVQFEISFDYTSAVFGNNINLMRVIVS